MKPKNYQCLSSRRWASRVLGRGGGLGGGGKHCPIPKKNQVIQYCNNDSIDQRAKTPHSAISQFVIKITEIKY